MPGVVSLGMNCDDCGIPIPLPFPVSIYNQTFTSAIVGSNGTLAFGNPYDFAAHLHAGGLCHLFNRTLLGRSVSGHFYLPHMWRVHYHYRHCA